MPGAKTHDVLTIVTGAALAPLAYAALLTQKLSGETIALDTGLLIGAHLLSGLLFSPDLDIDSAIDHRWGLFYWIWRPYMWAVPHRHWLSHGLIFAPLLRLAYFFTVVALLFVGSAWALGQLGIVVPNYLEQAVHDFQQLASSHQREVLLVLLGFITGGAVHTIADWLVTGGKHILHALGWRVTRDYTGHDHGRPYPRGRRSRFG